MSHTMILRLVLLVFLIEGICLPASAQAAQRVFVTAGTFTASFGGLAAGDQICNVEAQTAGLPGTWVAWLSDDVTDARDRLPGNGPFVRTDGTIVAADRAELLSGTLTNSIVTGGNVGIWTGTYADGTRSGFSCQGWSEETQVLGTYGGANRTNYLWTAVATAPCDRIEAHLYCFELPAVSHAPAATANGLAVMVGVLIGVAFVALRLQRT